MIGVGKRIADWSALCGHRRCDDETRRVRNTERACRVYVCRLVVEPNDPTIAGAALRSLFLTGQWVPANSPVGR